MTLSWLLAGFSIGESDSITNEMSRVILIKTSPQKIRCPPMRRLLPLHRNRTRLSRLSQITGFLVIGSTAIAASWRSWFLRKLAWVTTSVFVVHAYISGVPSSQFAFKDIFQHGPAWITLASVSTWAPSIACTHLPGSFTCSMLISGCLTLHNSAKGLCVPVVFSQPLLAGCHIILWRILSWENWSSSPRVRPTTTQRILTWSRTFSHHGVRDTTPRASGSRSLSRRLSSGRASRYPEIHC